MGSVHTAIIDIDEDIGAGKAKVIFRCSGIGGSTDDRAAKIVSENAVARGFDLLDAGESGDGGKKAGRDAGAPSGAGAPSEVDSEDGAEGRTVFSEDFQAEARQLHKSRGAGVREAKNVELSWSVEFGFGPV